MNARRLLVPLVLVLAVATAGWAVQQQAAGTFPHTTHVKLFPTCAGCHSGITSGDTATMFPTKAVCAQCHNGTDERLVRWAGYSWQPTNLKFSHTAHEVESSAKGNPAVCANCHGLQAGHDTAWMHVAAPSPDACLACHQAPEHLAASANCTTCHLPLTQVPALPASAIAAFPKPPWHSDSNFLAAHAPTTAASAAQCAICHARESCARCHPNADQLPAIQALASDPRVASLTKGRVGVYFTPASHEVGDWASEHGKDAAANYRTCASCHTQSSCRACHRGDLGRSAISKLPQAKSGRAPGIVLVLDSTTSPTHALTAIQAANTQTTTLLASARDTVHVRMHLPGFATNHKTVAASGLLNCQGCHQPRDCTACHDGVSTRQSYHPADFMSRHAEPAFALEQNCSSCHRVETFCRNCHQQSGIANSARVRGSAHNAQPLWLLQHGQAARQGLTSCAACHQQNDCLRCHSNIGMHINPHGPNFNAQLMGSKNMQMCLLCHVTNPLKRGG